MLPGYGAIVGARPGGGTTLAPGGAGAGRGDENAKLGGENCEVSLMHLGCVIAFLKDEDPDNERGGVFGRTVHRLDISATLHLGLISAGLNCGQEKHWSGDQSFRSRVDRQALLSPRAAAYRAACWPGLALHQPARKAPRRGRNWSTWKRGTTCRRSPPPQSALCWSPPRTPEPGGSGQGGCDCGRARDRPTSIGQPACGGSCLASRAL